MPSKSFDFNRIFQYSVIQFTIAERIIIRRLKIVFRHVKGVAAKYFSAIHAPADCIFWVNE
ncbi:MAG: hypothetical protein CVV37_00010 [Nitrospira bacterium HGW-Nitrospira-1]|nr:MAG: hypothetical protein CVV37_00010 [Nitrospira bacterium HGW-Nitrospira-1]